MINLSLNENPRGPGDQALAAIAAASKMIGIYPNERDFTHQLAARHGVEPENILLGNGSSEVLSCVARAFLAPGDESLMYEHSFLVYKAVSMASGATVVETKAKNHGYDLVAMQAAITNKTRVIWIDNPNNPTGSLIAHTELKAFITGLPPSVVIVLDEAYWDYLPDMMRINTVQWLQEFPNLILTRTFSKLHGLAGLRIGYGIASPENIKRLQEVRLPFTVNSLALAAAGASLADLEHIIAERQANEAGLEQLKTGLDKLKFEHLPSYANFITVRFDDSATAHQRLLSAGINTLPLTSYGLPDFLRITIGTPEQNRQLLSVLNLKEGK